MRTTRVKRYRAGVWEEQEDYVAEEAFLELWVGERILGAFVCSPDQIRELVYGHLAGLGLIRSADEVLDYQEVRDFPPGLPGKRVRVAVKLDRPPPAWPMEGAVWSECSASSEDLIPPRFPRPLFSLSALLALPSRVLALAEGFRRTGAQHSAALCDHNLEILFFAEDIGRHNAIDKVMGAALLARKPCAGALLYTSGRVSPEVVVKALRLGLAAVASPGAPLWGAVALARHYGLGLIGFLRDQRLNLYAGEDWFSP